MAKQPSKKIPVQKATPLPQQAWMLTRPLLWLSVAVIIVYAVSLSFGLTELDDSIFIRELKPYLEDMTNLVTSFHQGLFHPTNDMYYRPLFMDMMILNYHLSGDNVAVYHLINILLHIGVVMLVYKLFTATGLKPIHAFLLALVFAVHPVLSQAVAWIPGRNDTMLALFTVCFLLYSIYYSNDGKIKWLLLSFLMLLLAFFTKETAVFNAPVAFVWLVIVMGRKMLDKKQQALYGSWILAFGIWYGVRSQATLKGSDYTNAGQIMYDFAHRLPVLVQYMGKIFLPFNLNVFPILQDTVYYYGIAAIIILGALLYFAKGKDMKLIWGGFTVFVLFIIPALLVPNKLNDQTFEHRLYLPMLGMLLVLSQTIMFLNKTADKQLMYNIAGICGILGAITILHQQDFKDPITFWTAAEKNSPHSAYAAMMLGERLGNADDKPEAYRLIRKSYSMDSTEKYINYFYGMMLKNQDSVLQSEKYFLKEKQVSGFAECDFHLAAVAFAKNDMNSAEHYLESYIAANPGSEAGNNNLLLLYIQQKQKAKAEAQIKAMQQRNLPVNGQLVQQVNGLP